ncbi:hypothetical protein A2U01_0103087, partial [Trifolium medium]|nr:hypothetical protein [Trifolium medium]
MEKIRQALAKNDHAQQEGEGGFTQFVSKKAKKQLKKVVISAGNYNTRSRDPDYSL